MLVRSVRERWRIPECKWDRTEKNRGSVKWSWGVHTYRQPHDVSRYNREFSSSFAGLSLGIARAPPSASFEWEDWLRAHEEPGLTQRSNSNMKYTGKPTSPFIKREQVRPYQTSRDTIKRLSSLSTQIFPELMGPRWGHVPKWRWLRCTGNPFSIGSLLHILRRFWIP
jgi:hypothetical protein